MPRIKQFQDVIARLYPRRDQQRQRVLTATIQVTDDCNLRCTYCYQINKHHHVIDFETGKKFIDMLLNCSNGMDKYYSDELDGIVLEFIGGEPFMAIDMVEKLTDYFIDSMIQKNHPLLNRYRISICSNGELYFDARVQAYIKKHMHHLSFSISIDGNKELHDACRVFADGSGSYDIAIAGVKHYTEVLGGKMGSKMTLAPQNIGSTYEAVKSLIEIGYDEINLNCVYEEGWTAEHAKTLYAQLKMLANYMIDNHIPDSVYVSMFEENFFRPKAADDLDNWCGGDGQMIAVDYKGDLYPCIRYMESSLGEDVAPIKIGNVDTGIMTTECEKECVACLQCIDRRSQSTDECFHCPIAEGCSWCTAYNYQVFGTPDKRATYICVMHKARALANAYYWNKKFRQAGENKRMKLWIPKEWALEIIDEDEWNNLKQMEG